MKCAMLGVAVAAVVWVSLIVALEVSVWGWNGNTPDWLAGFAFLGGAVAGMLGFLVGDRFAS